MCTMHKTDGVFSTKKFRFLFLFFSLFHRFPALFSHFSSVFFVFSYFFTFLQLHPKTEKTEAQAAANAAVRAPVGEAVRPNQKSNLRPRRSPDRPPRGSAADPRQSVQPLCHFEWDIAAFGRPLLSAKDERRARRHRCFWCY